MVKKGNSLLQIVQHLLLKSLSLSIIVLSVCQEKMSLLTGMPQDIVRADWCVTRRWSWIGGMGGRKCNVLHYIYSKEHQSTSMDCRGLKSVIRDICQTGIVSHNSAVHMYTATLLSACIHTIFTSGLATRIIASYFLDV